MTVVGLVGKVVVMRWGCAGDVSGLLRTGVGECLGCVGICFEHALGMCHISRIDWGRRVCAGHVLDMIWTCTVK